MKPIRYNEEKDRLLRVKRGVGFEEVISIIQNEKVVDVIDNPNKEKFSRQKYFIVEINNYIYVVPFVEDENEIFLKTLFPSRKYTKRYFKK